MPEKIYTYATTRGFGKFFMPVPAQNSCMREYCAQLNKTFVFPLVELYYENCYSQFFRLLESVPSNADICTYSILMLPQSTLKFELMKTIMESKKLKFHFVFEKRVARTPDSIEVIKAPYYLGQLINNEYKSKLNEIVIFNKKIREAI